MKKFLCCLFLIICMLLGCSCNLGAYKYHISVVREGFTLREEWKTANRTYGTYYRAETAEGAWDTLVDKTSPETRTHLMVREEEVNEGFSRFPTVDFEKQMVIVHFYTDIYNRKQKIDYAKLDGKRLDIRFSITSNNGRGGASMPGTRTLILIMDKLSVEQVTITYNG